MAARAAKRAAKAEANARKGKPAEWLPVEGWWFAYALDGRGHHDGDGEYEVRIPVADFGGRLFLGGDARITGVHGGDPTTIYRLPPTVVPPPDGAIAFRLIVHPRASRGRFIVVDGLEVRAHM